MLESHRDLDEFREHFSDNIAGISKLFDAGIIGSAVFVDDVLVGYMWYATEKMYEEKYNYTFRLKEEQVYQTAGYLIPMHRGRLMVLDGMKYGQDYFKERDFKTTMCVADTEDQPIMRLHFKLGFEEIGKLLHTRKLLFYRWSRVEHYEGTRYDAFKGPRRAGGGIDGGGR